MSTSTTHTRARQQQPTPSAQPEVTATPDAACLAEMWGQALAASFRLGYTNGHRTGWLQGRDEEATAWQAIVTGYSAVLSEPDRSELARLRAPSNEPCPRRCDACSQCIRAAAAAANRARYGSPDFPGLAVRPLTEQRPS